MSRQCEPGAYAHSKADVDGRSLSNAAVMATMKPAVAGFSQSAQADFVTSEP